MFKYILFNLEKTQISVRVLSGNYPDTTKLIPTSFAHKLHTISYALNSAIDRASVFSPEKNNVVKLLLSEDKIEISAKSQEQGSSTEKISAYRYEGSRLEIAFTSKYVLEAVRAIGTEDICISFNGDMNPFIIRSKDDESVTQLILPVRTY